MRRTVWILRPAITLGILTVLAATLSFPAAAVAQVGAGFALKPSATLTVPATHASPGFGNSSSILSVGFPSFVPETSGVTYDQVFGSAIYFFQSSTTSVAWWARVNLPSGVIIDSIELDACDTSTSGRIDFAMTSTDAGADAGEFLTPIGSTGTTQTPGCGLFSVTPSSPPVVVNNSAKNYWLFINWAGNFSAANAVTGVRVHYHLQVSPDPPTATFADVPVGHPQHRFVEALVAAGITAGCGGGNYCPTAPITRGQMAVFLSVALGLNFPN